MQNWICCFQLSIVYISQVFFVVGVIKVTPSSWSPLNYWYNSTFSHFVAKEIRTDSIKLFFFFQQCIQECRNCFQNPAKIHRIICDSNSMLQLWKILSKINLDMDSNLLKLTLNMFVGKHIFRTALKCKKRVTSSTFPMTKHLMDNVLLK